MIFARPWLLLLLAIPVLLIAWEVLRSGSRTAMPFDHGTHRRRRVLPRLLRAAGFLPPMVLAAVLLLLAGPQRMAQPERRRQVTNIQLLLDVSGSMGWPMASGGGTRYETAMEAISRFTSQRKGDSCGLTIFGGETIHWTPLTKDLDAISRATPFLDPSRMPIHMRSTMIAKALRSCTSLLSDQEEGDKLIILVSDGQSADFRGGTAATVGIELFDAGIILYAIHIGDGAAPGELYEAVQPTGGRVFAAHDSAGLQEIFDHIDRMQPAQLKPAAPEPVDYFQPFAWVGLACLCLHQLFLFKLRVTPW